MRRHHRPMRRLLIFTVVLLSGCATAPEAPKPQPVTPVVQAPPERGDLVGLTAGELVQRLGTPALQIREGPSLKLQFRAPSCILDAYLYLPPSGQGLERVTHVDARLRSGVDTDQRGCVAALEGA
jgi:uncharacterized protein YceK